MCFSFSAGIIPAYAGNTPDVASVVLSAWDHPRVCGEHRPATADSASGAGSSPRMRGTHADWLEGRRVLGIIPAYAGNTLDRLFALNLKRDHPRVCGEHPSMSIILPLTEGSSPRMRGTLLTLIFPCPASRIIPAYAGNTPAGYSVAWCVRDHPRVCGEHIEYTVEGATSQGSSPRMRGTQIPAFQRFLSLGIIPAYAGNTLRDYSNFVVSKFMSFVFHLV